MYNDIHTFWVTDTSEGVMYMSGTDNEGAHIRVKTSEGVWETVYTDNSAGNNTRIWWVEYSELTGRIYWFVTGSVTGVRSALPDFSDIRDEYIGAAHEATKFGGDVVYGTSTGTKSVAGTVENLDGAVTYLNSDGKTITAILDGRISVYMYGMWVTWTETEFTPLSAVYVNETVYYGTNDGRILTA